MGRADAGRLAVGSGGASPSVQAGLRGTAVCRSITVAACVSWGAGAAVVADAVYAGGAVGAGVRGTLVDVDLAA